MNGIATGGYFGVSFLARILLPPGFWSDFVGFNASGAFPGRQSDFLLVSEVLFSKFRFYYLWMMVDHALDLGPFPELLPYFDLVASAEPSDHLFPSTMRLVRHDL